MRATPTTTPTAGTRFELGLCFATAVALAAMVWALPRPIDDLFVALAGGRDIVAGKLGTPDDWAFTTHGRVWLDQNWGTHWATFLVWRAFGEGGLLAQKAVMLAATMAFIVLACRARGVAVPTALLVAGGAIAASRSYVDLRPNLTSIMLTPLVLWMLYRSRARPSLVWVAAFVVWIWSNAHGGFVLGIALMALWAGSVAIAAALEAERHRVARGWNAGALAAAATIAAFTAAAFANPFGVANVTHPLVVAREPIWRNVDEWRPLFTSARTPFGTVWEFLVVVVVWGAALVHHGLAAARRSAAGTEAQPENAARTAIPTVPFVFDVAAGFLAVAMALQARRFVPLAILVVAPTIARELDCVLHGRPRRAVVIAIALMLLIPPALLTRPLVRRYRSDNPLYPTESLLARMVVTHRFFPSDAVAFVKANGIDGPVFNAWAWEGFLRWHDTKLQFFAGSRAQQVYDAATYARSLELLQGGERAPATLESLGVHLVLVPLAPDFNALLGALVLADDAHWSYLYNDGQHMLLADATWPQNAARFAALRDGTLEYPDAAIGLLSRGLYLASPAAHGSTTDARAALEDAAATRPIGLAYAALGDLAMSGRIPLRDAIAFLEGERGRLAARAVVGAGSVDVLGARRWLAMVLAGLYGRVGRAHDAEASRRDLAAATAQRAELERAWGWGDTPGFTTSDE